MKEYAIRLEKGVDLKKTIEEVAKTNAFDTVVVLSGVGSVSQVKIRLAKASSNSSNYIDVKEDFEIVSLTGTVSCGKAHLHISLADEIGDVIGGHLCEGTIINTTCELVLGVLEEYESTRKYDSNTGFSEIEFRKKV